MSGESLFPSPVYLQTRSPIRFLVALIPSFLVACHSCVPRHPHQGPVATNEAILQVSLYLSLVSRAWVVRRTTVPPWRSPLSLQLVARSPLGCLELPSCAPSPRLGRVLVWLHGRVPNARYLVSLGIHDCGIRSQVCRVASAGTRGCS